MKKTILSITIILLTISGYSQKYTLSGYITDDSSGENIIGATIYDLNNLQIGTVTNAYGFFSLTINKGKVKLGCSFIGYEDKIQEFELTKDSVITISLRPNAEIEEVIITGKQDQVKTSQMSSVEIPINAVHKLPVLFGETDVLKTVQLMPGVQSGSEGTSGIYVRGGGPDQNLILLDGVPVYNVNHLFGFFSVFNGYAIKDITLIKGGFPARYGGRLSSVLDIRMKEGNMKQYSGELSTSIIATKFSFEGPIIKDKSSFIISARRTYLDIIAFPFIKIFQAADDYTDKLSAGYFFDDINAKINYKFSDKDRLFLSAYTGKDKAYMKMEEGDLNNQDTYGSKTNFDLHWGNLTTALRWSHIFTPKLFGNTTLTHSRYNFVTDISNEFQMLITESATQIYRDKYEIEYLSGIIDFSGKIDFDWHPSPNHKIKFGINETYHTFKPGVSAIRISEEGNPYGENIDTTYGSRNVYANEAYIYFEDDFKIGKKLKINAGIHASLFDVRDTLYHSFEPRISARFLISDNWSVKAAYSEMTQYLHLLTSSKIGLPTDLWLPATDKLPPQKSFQYAIGSAVTLPNNLDLTIEAFYKEMTNLIEYKEGASFFDDPEEIGGDTDSWENKIEIGDGNSYGAEILLQKKYGDFSGWLGYTLSWTNRQFENISNGDIFPYRYDRRHDISLALTYKINEKIDMGFTWVYGTGVAVTLAQQRYLPFNRVENQINSGNMYYWDSETIEYYGTRNGYRLPDYHRLDVGINFSKEKKRGRRTWSVSVYNTYNRLNAFYVQFEDNYDNVGNSTGRELMKYSLFPIIPSVSYIYKFK